MRFPSIISKTVVSTVTSTLAALALGATLSVPASAQSNTLTVTTPDGRTFTREATRSGPAGDRSGTIEWTGPDGRVTTREFRRQFDRENGFRRQGTITGPNGRTATVRGQARCAGGACERTVERRGFGGARSTVRGQGRLVEPGVLEGRRSVTGPRGRERTLRWRRVQR